LNPALSISECDSTIQGRLTGIQGDDGFRAIFHSHGWSDLRIKCSQRFEELWGKSKAIITTVVSPDEYCWTSFPPSTAHP